MLGCERCLRDCGCEIIDQTRDYQAFYQCNHGLNPLNDQTNDCYCQIPLLASNISKIHVPHLSNGKLDY